jgi:ABC-2 type transport system ATP-binding protein
LADRVGVINHGEIILVEEKDKLMRELGKKQLTLHLYDPIQAVPASLNAYSLELSEDRQALTYNYDTRGEHTGITDLINDMRAAGLRFNDLQTSQSSLEDIFVGLVHQES